MKTLEKISAVLLAAALAFGAAACSEERGTREEAKALAHKAAAFLEEAGPITAFEAFTKRDEWRAGDLYVFVYNDGGDIVAHGFQPELIGQNYLDVTDAGGKHFAREIVAVEEEGWVDYQWRSPASGEIEEKSSYIVRVDKYLVGAGAYDQ